MDERRIIIVGKTGNGKSSTGNSILQGCVFKTERSLAAVTKECKLVKGFGYNEYAVCDTPGLFDTDTLLRDRLLEIQKSVLIHCQKPHAFLLVFSSLNRLTRDEEDTTRMLEIMFGEELFDHCIIVFTRGDEFDSNDEFKEYLSKSDLLDSLKSRCNDRVVRIDNKSRGNISNLLSMIEKMSNNGRNVYSCPDINIHTSFIQERIDHKVHSEEFAEFSLEIHERKRQAKKKLKMMERIRLALSTVGGTSVAGFGITTAVVVGGVPAIVAGCVAAVTGSAAVVIGAVLHKYRQKNK